MGSLAAWFVSQAKRAILFSETLNAGFGDGLHSSSEPSVCRLQSRRSIYQISSIKMTALSNLSSYLPSLSPFWRNAFLAIGIIHSLEFSSRIFNFFYLYARSSTINRYIQPQSYALVTGATGGIGKGFVLALLKRGCNVIIHGRNEERLAALQAEFQKQFPDRKILTVAASALDPRTAVPKIEQFIKERQLCVTILVNNVGGLGSLKAPNYSSLEDIAPDDIDETVTLNALFPVHLTSTLIPLLGKKEPDSQKSQPEALPSLIMNLGSYAGQTGIPLISCYAGCKGFNLAMSNALSWELPIKHKDIEAMGILVGSVASQGNDEDPPSRNNPTSEDFAEASLNRVGCGRRIVYGYFWHALQTSIFELFSEKKRGEMMRKIMVARKIKVEERSKEE